MKLRLSELWRWDGTVDRSTYALIGVMGFAIKHNLDRVMATLVFHRPWGLFNYWTPLGRAVQMVSFSREDQLFLGTMLTMAVPFIWVGVVLTLRRLRAIGLPAGWVALFFIPAINLVFFALLSVLPSRAEEELKKPLRGGPVKPFLDKLIPDHPLGSAAMALLLISPFGVVATLLGTKTFSQYGWGLFVGLPFCLGLGSVLLDGYHRPHSYPRCLLVSWLTILLTSLALLALAIEGVFCLVMAAPMAVVLAAVGGSLGYLIQRRSRTAGETGMTLLVVLLSIPAFLGAERATPLEPSLLRVRTAIEVKAPPEVVWRNVVAFAQLPPPSEWLFRMGIAYPMRAEIQGHGAGAVRHCVFSTGAFVEPIEVWDEPRLLKFSVTENPSPMQEWTPYKDLHPPHLDGFLTSRAGQFLLTPRPGGRTRLEGTTWYYHHMWPASYWQLWSDWIIHKIHLRVIQHIKHLSEL